MSRSFVLIVAWSILVAPSAAAQHAPAVSNPPFEIAPSIMVNHDQVSDSTTVGLDLSAAINLSPRIAVVGDVAREFKGNVTVLAAGPRISTGFFDPGTGDGIPGRFFARALAGGEVGGTEDQFVLIVGVGSDAVIPASRRGVTLHLGLDYRFTPMAAAPSRRFAGWRVLVGTVFGPRLVQ